MGVRYGGLPACEGARLCEAYATRAWCRGTGGATPRVPWVVHGHDHEGRRFASRVRAAGVVLLGAYLLTVGWLTLRPRPVAWVSPSNLRPFSTIQADLAAGPQAALEGIGGGVLLLAPVGVLLPLATGRLHRPLASTAVRTVSAGVLIALGVAGLRSIAPGLVVTLDDVMLNAAGIALVHLALYPPLRRRLLARRRAGDRIGRRAAGTQGRTPRSSRGGVAPERDARHRGAALR